MRLDLRLDVLQLVHKLLVNVQTTCRVEENIVVAVILGELDSFLSNLNGIGLSHFKDGNSDTLTDNL